MCGEQCDKTNTRHGLLGSPPRVRGTAKPRLFLVLDARITPACAGNSFPFVIIHEIQKDHPRVCGEQYDANMENAVEVGSPPRVRGTVDFFPLGSGIVRITPACAGNSYSSHQRTPQAQDHPRVCGEQ